MSVDSVKSNANSTAYADKRRALEDERAEELDTIEKKYRKQVSDTRKARSEEVKKIKEEEGEEISEVSTSATAKIKRNQEAQQERIKSYQEESAKLTEEARKKLQGKATELSRFSKELENQEETLRKQHTASLIHQEQNHERNMKAKEKSLNVVNQEIAENHDKAVSKLKNQQRDELKYLQEQGTIEKNFFKEDIAKDAIAAKKQREMNETVFEQEKTNVKRNNQKQLNELRLANESAQFSEQSSNDKSMQNIHNQYKQAVQGEMLRGQRELNKMREFNAINESDVARQNKRSITEANQRAKTRIDAVDSESKFQEQVAKQTYEKRKNIYSEQTKKTLNELEVNQNKMKEQAATGYQDKINQLNSHHNKTYSNKQALYQSEIQNQENAAQKQLNDIIANSATVVGATSNKQSDSFYKLRNFDATFSESDNDYVVNVKVPEHEKDSVHITSKPGSITISGTRRFENKAKTEDGHSVSTNSYQSYAETIPIQGRLDASKMSRQYSNGKLQFKIPKV